MDESAGERAVKFNDPELVADEYATEERFAVRRAVFSDLVEGERAEDLAIDALREVGPARVLEVGCGLGDFAARIMRELGADVVAVDVSPRMIELARARGVKAFVADAQELPFDEGEFNCVVANWVLHHLPHLDRALSEIGRVLETHGRLVVATFSSDHLRDLYDWLGDPRVGELEFSSENGMAPLRRHFADVERRDADGIVTFPDRAAVHAYLSSLVRGSYLADRLPAFEDDFRARSRQSVFVCDSPS
jgi:SAM-dependent methyltransferase